ncbi:hypothetical protein SK1NUM_14980 [Arachnia rubra]|nr:hypothetical protein SK1NUM_14980 [Arachnia rubra]
MVRNDQRGLTGSVQVALLLPLAVLVLLATLQWALLLWAESTAMAAAQDSARAAAALGASEADGQAAGERAVSNSGIGNVTIAVSRTTGFSNAVVRGAAIRVLPLVDVTVRQEAMVPVERTR